MKKKQYRILAVLAVILLMVTMAACHGEPSAPSEAVPVPEQESTALQEAKDAFEADWEAYLEISDAVNGRVLWALDYAGDFARDSTWENLLKARAASAAVKLELQMMNLPEQTMTQAQYMLLIESGIEADVVSLMYENLPLLHSNSLTTIMLLDSIISKDIFFDAVAEGFSDWVEVQRQIIQFDNEYLCITTNYLLLQLGDDSLWEAMPAAYPVVASGCGEWIEDPESLMRNCDAVLDQIDEMELAIVEYTGVYEYTLGIVEEAVATGDLSRLSNQMKDIQGVPAYFPIPPWMPADVNPYYLVTDHQSLELKLVQSGEEISQIPAACYILCSGIIREDVECYGENLKAYGLNPYIQWDEEAQTYQILVPNGECWLMIQWTPEETILYLNEPVGCLIPELYYVAMDME